MLVLYYKELRSFLSSLIGYIAIAVFVTLIGLFMWIIPTEAGGYNVIDNGFANIDPLFVLAPWVYLFLIPAITMRSFSEERKGGTIELLLTRPLTDMQIVLAKYFAGFTLVGRAVAGGSRVRRRVGRLDRFALDAASNAGRAGAAPSRARLRGVHPRLQGRGHPAYRAVDR